SSRSSATTSLQTIDQNQAIQVTSLNSIQQIDKSLSQFVQPTINAESQRNSLVLEKNDNSCRDIHISNRSVMNERNQEDNANQREARKIYDENLLIEKSNDLKQNGINFLNNDNKQSNCLLAVDESESFGNFNQKIENEMNESGEIEVRDFSDQNDSECSEFEENEKNKVSETSEESEGNDGSEESEELDEGQESGECEESDESEESEESKESEKKDEHMQYPFSRPYQFPTRPPHFQYHQPQYIINSPSMAYTPFNYVPSQMHRISILPQTQNLLSGYCLNTCTNPIIPTATHYYPSRPNFYIQQLVHSNANFPTQSVVQNPFHGFVYNSLSLPIGPLVNNQPFQSSYPIQQTESNNLAETRVAPNHEIYQFSLPNTQNENRGIIASQIEPPIDPRSSEVTSELQVASLKSKNSKDKSKSSSSIISDKCYPSSIGSTSNNKRLSSHSSSTISGKSSSSHYNTTKNIYAHIRHSQHLPLVRPVRVSLKLQFVRVVLVRGLLLAIVPHEPHEITSDIVREIFSSEIDKNALMENILTEHEKNQDSKVHINSLSDSVPEVPSQNTKNHVDQLKKLSQDNHEISKVNLENSLTECEDFIKPDISATNLLVDSINKLSKYPHEISKESDEDSLSQFLDAIKPDISNETGSGATKEGENSGNADNLLDFETEHYFPVNVLNQSGVEEPRDDYGDDFDNDDSNSPSSEYDYEEGFEKSVQMLNENGVMQSFENFQNSPKTLEHNAKVSLIDKNDAIEKID
ncbi:hypothetical protein HK096_003967, partial [Nowakowskiella sp. JEL0078]